MNDSTIRPNNNGGGDNSSTIKPNNSTILPSRNGGGDNSSTIRPNNSTILPNNNGGGDNSSTIKPGSSTIQPSGNNGGGANGSTIKPSRNGGGNNGSNTLRMGNGNNGGTINMGGARQQGGNLRRKRQNANNANTDYKNSKNAVFGMQEIIVDGKRLHVVKFLNQMSGEAQLIRARSKDKEFMVKLYFGNIHPNHDILEKVKTIPRGLNGLMRLYQHGVWTNPDDDSDKRDYEVMELCEGGMLSDTSTSGNEEKWKALALQMACSIDLCHQRGFIHLDVKPDNFLFVDKQRKELVLGDFGLAVAHDADGNGQATQARTKKYAAPEIYQRIDDALIDVSTKSDYYSLGMSLMELWMGKDKFNSMVGNLNERQLMNMKINNKLPMPDGLSSHSLSLLKALLRADSADRAGFDDIQRWAKGESLDPSIEQATPQEQEPEFKILFNGAKNQVAHSMKDLANFMVGDRELAKKFLYSGKLSKQIEQIYPEVAIDLDEITEELYPSDKEAGLYAAIYTLDDERAWIGRKGEACNTFAEMAKTVLEDFSHYKDALKSGNHSFYVYLRVNDADNWADDIHRQLAKNSPDNLLRFIYEYNGNLPFRIVTDDDKIHYVNNIDDVLQYATRLSDDSKWEVTCGGFTKWVEKRNGMVGAEVETYLKKNKWSTQCLPGVMYRLNKKCDYNYHIVTGNNDPKAQFTPEQLATRLNNLLAQYGRKSNIYAFFQEFESLAGSRLEYYLDARGFDKAKQYIKYCFDLNSDANSKKPGPYNEYIAAYKCIAGIGKSPYYKCGSKTIYSLADMSKLSSAEKQQELRNGLLEEWLTLSFQEKPRLDLSKKYTYELATKAFLEYVGNIDSTHKYATRFHDAVKKTQGLVGNVDSLRRKLKAMRILVFVLGIVPLVLMAAYSVFVGTPFEGNPLASFNGTLYGILFVICTLAMFAVGKGAGSCIGELIWGAVISAAIYGIIYLALRFLLPFSGYIIAAGLATYAWRVYKSCLQNTNPQSGISASLGTDELVVEPLHFAYRSGLSIYDFEPTVSINSCQQEQRLKDVISKSRKNTIWSIVTCLLILATFLALGTGKLASPAGNTNYAEIITGTWNGEFEGRPATLVITSVDSKKEKVKGTMYVKFKNLAEEEVDGGYLAEGGSLYVILKDVNKNGTLDGSYTINVDKENLVMSCEYENETTNKHVSFTLTKDTGEKDEMEQSQVITDDGESKQQSETTNRQEASKRSNRQDTKSDETPINKEPSHKGEFKLEEGKPSGKSSGGGFKLEEGKPSGKSSGGGFKLEEVKQNGKSSGGGFKLEEVN